jgi:galactokinase
MSNTENRLHASTKSLFSLQSLEQEGRIAMTEILDWKRRLEGNPARNALAELYGADAGTQAKRYLELAESVLREKTRAGAPSAELRFYSAPGRTELGGNHTDHNRGRVLCAAVDLDAIACVSPREDGRIELVSEGYPDQIRVDLSALEPVPAERGSTTAIVRGVARGLANVVGADLVGTGHAAGRGPRSGPLRGFTARMSSRVLPGSGLSSSAAFEVLVGAILADLAGVEISPVEIAKIGQFAENEYFGKPCGLMDQTASAVGGVVSIDFADPSSPVVKRVEYDFAKKGIDLVIVNTGGSHADLTPEYAAVPAEMKSVAKCLGAAYLREIDRAILVARGPEIRRACGDRAFLRALHFIAENDRVSLMVKALEADDLDAYLTLVEESGRSSWELLQNLYPGSAPREQGLPVALALTKGFLGREGASRVHGGGFAGTIQAYVPSAKTAGYGRLMESYFGPGAVIPASPRAKGVVRVEL